VKIHIRLFSMLLAVLFGFSTAHVCAATTEGATEYMDDAVMTTKVKAAMVNEPALKASDVKVETNKGTVPLSGFAGSKAEADKAAEVARSVKGVTAVQNEMSVK
jgi:osmotically-inducible protein OsmY